MSGNMQQLVSDLKKPFELSEHNIRKGQGGQWFVYVKKQSIMGRLDALAPMEWQTDIVETVRIDNRVEVVMSMRILNTTRSFDGVADDNGKNALSTRKAATTDAFKRVAMLFGIGRYLLDGDKITCNNEADAKRQFAAWYNKRFARPTESGTGRSPQKTEPPVVEDRPAVYACKMTHMNYNVNGKGKYLGFANCDPILDHTNKDKVVIRAYGRSTKVLEWLGQVTYDKLGLAQYGESDKTSKFIKMPIDGGIEFEYVEETTAAGETYLKAIGVADGNDSF